MPGLDFQRLLVVKIHGECAPVIIHTEYLTVLPLTFKHLTYHIASPEWCTRVQHWSVCWTAVQLKRTSSTCSEWQPSMGWAGVHSAPLSPSLRRKHVSAETAAGSLVINSLHKVLPFNCDCVNCAVIISTGKGLCVVLAGFDNS